MQIKPHATDTRGVYIGIISGNKSVVALTERDRAKAEYKESSVTVAPTRIRAGLNLAGELHLPYYIAVSISVAGRFNNSVTLTYDLFKKIKQASSVCSVCPHRPDQHDHRILIHSGFANLRSAGITH
jgi:hypothetical protein